MKKLQEGGQGDHREMVMVNNEDIAKNSGVGVGYELGACLKKGLLMNTD